MVVKREICEECKRYKYQSESSEYVCGNIDSDYLGIPSAYDDSCFDFEERED